MYHGRRMFGGGLSAAWPFALVALHYLSGFEERYARAVRISEDWIRGLQQHEAFAIDRVPSGTNLFRLRVKGVDPVAVSKAARRQWRHAVGAAARHVPGRRERDAQSHDRVGPGRRLRSGGGRVSLAQRAANFRLALDSAGERQ